MRLTKKKSREINPKKRNGSIHIVVKTPWKVAERFHGYRIVPDDSWLRRGQTFEQANHIMQRSIKNTGSISGVPCIWVDDLKLESRVLNSPTSHTDRKERTCNSFLQYRILVQRCFRGQQTDISKEVEALWRNESKEMLFFCLRNSEIETRMSPWRNGWQ